MINLLRRLIRESIVRPKLYVLVGPAGVGKSDWVRRNVTDPHIVSYDAAVDAVRKPLGLKYDDVAGSGGGAHRKSVESIHKSVIRSAVDSGKDIVVDMTNMGQRARRRALSIIRGHEEDYEKIAVVFDFRGMESLVHSSVEKRAKELQDKHLSRKIVQDMMDRFEMPTYDEGFDEIIVVDPSDALNRP